MKNRVGFIALWLLTGCGCFGAVSADQIKLWDLNKFYDDKHYEFTSQWADRAHWTQVPFGTTTWTFNGDAAIEGENFWLSFHSSPADSIFMYAKVDAGGTPGRHNEMYRSWDTPNGLRNYGGGSKPIKILKNNSGEIMVLSEAIPYTRGGYLTTVTASYRVLQGKPWTEIRAVSQCSEQGMHGESRIHISPDAGTGGGDFLADSMKDGLNGEGERVFHPSGSRMLLDFVLDADHIWTINWRTPKSNRSRSDTAYNGYQAGWQWMNDAFMTVNRIMTSPFVYYNAYYGDNTAYSTEQQWEPLVMGTLSTNNSWHFQNISSSLTTVTVHADQPVTGKWVRQYTRTFPHETVHPGLGSPWTPRYPGKYKIVGRVTNAQGSKCYTNIVDTAAPTDNYIFTSPVDGTLEYLITYLYDHNADTPAGVYSVMDEYREAIPAAVTNGTVTGKIMNAAGTGLGGIRVTNGVKTSTTTADGTYTLTPVPSGTYALIASGNGYETSYTAVDVPGGGTATLDVTLALDISSPVISAVSVPTIGATSLTISWMTDENSDSQVEYGLTAAYGSSSPLNASPVASHSVTIGGLTQMTLYHYRVKSRDANGNLAVSGDYTCSTVSPAPSQDPTPPANWSSYAGNGSYIWGRTRDNPHSGSFCAFLKPTVFASGSINVGIIAGDSNGYTGTNAYPATPNTTYNYSFWLRGDLTTTPATVITWTNAGTRGFIGIGSYTPSAAWTNYTGTFRTGSDIKTCAIQFKAYGDTGQENYGTLFIDDLQVWPAGGGNFILNGGAENGGDPGGDTDGGADGNSAGDRPFAYPVPCRGGSGQPVTISNIDAPAKVSIYSLNGVLVHEREVNATSYSFVPDGFPSGVFLYVVKGSKGTSNGKIIIIK